MTKYFVITEQGVVVASYKTKTIAEKNVAKENVKRAARKQPLVHIEAKSR